MSESELPAPMSLTYTTAAVARSAAEAESLEQRMPAPRRHDAAHEHAAHASPARRAARRDDGRRAGLRRLRSHHGAQRRLLQVPELRQLDGLLLILFESSTHPEPRKSAPPHTIRCRGGTVPRLGCSMGRKRPRS